MAGCGVLGMGARVWPPRFKPQLCVRKFIKASGVATEFSFAYSHVSLYSDVKDDKGNVE